MLRQASSRNQRSRGWKPKHVLQICLLVAVCVWLLYQVKHSHDKKKALEERNLKISDRVEESKSDFLKLGRKDPRGSDVVTATEHTTPIEEEEHEEAEEAVEQEAKQEDTEEGEGREVGDDGIDENDQERDDEEAEGGGELGDEEGEEGRLDDLGLADNQDHDGVGGNSQEAREEHYKADDASSAVVRDPEVIESEDGNLSAQNLDEEQKEHTEEKDLENDTKTNGTVDVSKDNELGAVTREGETQLYNNTFMNETATLVREPEVGSLSNSTTELESTNQMEQQNKTTTIESDHMEQQSNSTAVESNDQIERQKNSTEILSNNQTETQNSSTVVDAETSDSSPHNATDSVDDQNAMIEMKTPTPGEDNSSLENVLMEQTGMSNITEGVDESHERSSTSSTTNESSDAVQEESTNSSSNVVTITEESDGRTDPSTLPDIDARTDLSTLPDDIQVETKTVEDIAAE